MISFFNRYKTAIVLLAVLGTGYFGYKKFFSKKAEEKKQEVVNKSRFTVSEEILKRHPLTLVALKEVSSVEEVALPGRISYDPESMARAGSTVEARIQKVLVREGDRVSQGSPLAILSSVMLGEVEASYVKARASLEALKLQADRAKELFDMKVTSAKDYEFANMQYKTARTEVETTRIKLENYGLTPGEIAGIERGVYVSSNLVLRSPISGEVTERKAVQGQQVTRNEDLFTIANLTNLMVLLEVYEKDLGAISEGDDALIYPLGDEKSPGIRGEVAYVGTVLDNVKRTAKIRIMVSNRNGKLKPGQSVTAKVKGMVAQTGSEPRRTIPIEAVHEIEGKSMVFLRNEDGSFEAAEVVVGDTVGDEVVIQSGIREGAQVVSRGSFILKSEYLKL
ncbi:efflux RND transporter periplasmic adaptor subunit [Leptospira gomenensis]|uniref:Efflux RND transporter periplasmic adaptor subunit n=1 Tax=Leptospira gomenensis TaxID=2484974 RepID=A0A5F1Y6I1_9LEPT|nr:efflux RND transporter periplasmic adaptor subunit [Leptospira gomenensis]TGK28922.1 efflux RND transporter periplasmic adaptor subunit [Leptospira gomenensis]TGK40681.1 efflux RND transporter periplasmic adaptor subunit [Leptospira gomenensis]TGK42502.1 efflux RND transporter periplasmic adaptor subunit [Leptospira gomenensis]TGK68475.1 efflux RND transporter periplasmic adaptor subunit [Leptospira gomenensis]